MKRISSLDGLRAVSISLVMLAHASWQPEFAPKRGFLAEYGQLGVMIFFVISGFLITLLLLKEKGRGEKGNISVRKFYFRRVLRIIPVCYLYIATVYVALKMNDLDMPDSVLLGALTFTTNFSSGGWFVNHTWSLAVEEQFYLFWPWIVKASKRTMVCVACAIIFCAPFIRMAAYFWHLPSHYTLAPFLAFADSIMIGSLLAIFWQGNPDFFQRSIFRNKGIRLACFSLILLIVHLLQEKILLVFMMTLGKSIVSFCICYLLISVMVVRNDFVFRFLNHRLVVYLGTLSYSLYIWQELFLYWHNHNKWNFFEMPFFLRMILPFIVAAASYHLWESPFLKLKSRFKNV